MAAEFDTEPNYRDEDDPVPQSAPAVVRDDRGLWGMLAILLLAALVLLLLLTQYTARVPDTVGLSLADAKAKLTQAGFPIGDVSEVAAGSGRPGYVNEQAPRAGATVRTGTGVDLLVAAGGNLTRVPDVRGSQAAGASVKLLQAGFEVESAEEYSDIVPVGEVVSQSPEGGTRAADGSVVTVYYSLGPQSEADVAVSPSPAVNNTTGDGTTGSSAAQLMMNSTRAYPGAAAWSSRGNIYVRLSPGGSARRVTSTGDWDSSPVISPSRKYLVFLRAPGYDRRATSIGAVSFTDFDTYMLTPPVSDMGTDDARYYGKPVFAPSENSTTPNTDWIVFPQYWNENRGDGSALSARLLICNVPMNSSWVSWNLQFRPALTLSLGRSSRAGCVRVTQKRGSKTVYSRDFNATTGLYLR